MAMLCAVSPLLHEPWFMLHKTPFVDTWPHALNSILIMTLGELAFFMVRNQGMQTPLGIPLCPHSYLLSLAWRPYHDSGRFSLCKPLSSVLLSPCLQILAEFLLVLETSAVTFSVAGTVKEGATILVSVMHRHALAHIGRP